MVLIINLNFAYVFYNYNVWNSSFACDICACVFVYVFLYVLICVFSCVFICFFCLFITGIWEWCGYIV